MSHPARLPLDLFCAQNLSKAKDPRQANAQDLIQAKDLNATKDPHNAKDHKPIQDLNRSAIAQDLGAESTLDPKISAPAKDPRGESQNTKEARDE